MRRALGGASAQPGGVSVKAICHDGDGRVLLCRNHRGEWELPGGRPEVGEPFRDTAHRELHGEAGLDVPVDRFVGMAPLEVLPGRCVDLVAFACSPPPAGPQRPEVSDEHVALAFLDPAAVPAGELPDAYRRLVALS